MSTETYEYEKINAKDKPIAEDFVYVYSEIEDGGFRKVSKAMLKVLLGVATKLSELENDKAFITKTVLDLENYYLKSDTYSKDEIDNRISLIPRFDVQVVSSLPTTDISETTVYLVSSGDDSDNLYTEYINVNGLWEILGTQKIASVENSVLYTAQSLTDEQKAQARTNISAASAEEVGQLREQIADLKQNGVGSNAEPATDDIPKIFFDEAIPQTKDDVVTKFRYISETMDFEGYAEFKAQGNSSMDYSKKNVTVKMYKDAELQEKLKINFKGWGEQRKHVYKANWIDLTHARNIVSARIWAEIVKSRSNYMELPELFRTSPNQGAVDGFPIKVYSQGIYQGRYTLNIPKDAWMANMDDSLDNHCILCGENYYSGCFRASANINGGDWSDEVHDTVPTSIKTRWNEVISFVMNSTDEEFKANLGNYFFVDSLIDYFVFGVVSCGFDAFGKNQLYYTYDGLKWIAGMYDMDSTWGLWWNGSSFVSANYARSQFQDFTSAAGNGKGNLLYIRLEQLFPNEIESRYTELKKSVLSVANIINHFERFTDIASLDLVKEDYASTTGSGKFTGIPSKDTNNIQQIRQFVVDRSVYCDEYFASLGECGGEEEPDTPIEPEATLSSISATYNGGDVAVGTALTDLTGITVIGTYSDGSTSNIIGYTLTGTIDDGENTITVTYAGLTTTFIVIGIAEEIDDGIDYTLNPVETAIWKNGYEFRSGSYVEKTGNHSTEKIKLQNCLYSLSIDETSTITSCLIGIYNANGDYVGAYTINVGNTRYIYAQESYSYVLGAINGSETLDDSQITLMPVNNKKTAGERLELVLSELDWVVDGRFIACNNIDSVLNSHGITTSSKDNIKNINHIAVADSNTALTFGSSRLSALAFSILIYNDKWYLNCYNFMDSVENAIAYFEDNNSVLILNG